MIRASWSGVAHANVKAALLLFLFSPLLGRSQVVLNEIMANNANTIANGSSYPDWLELHNSGAETVDLGGMSLTDNAVLPRKYVFPAGTFIGPSGFLVLWCDSAFTAPGLHTGFSLKSSGETVTLFAADGVTKLDFVTFGLQVVDRSIGRVPDGPPGGWQLNQPTPGYANIAQALGSVSGLKLNEWAATNSASNFNGDDWLEIYNPATNPVALAGLTIADTNNITGSTKYNAITNLSFIDADGFQLFTCDSKRTPADHLNFRISSSNGSILAIFDTDRVNIIDQISFGPGTIGIDASMGRLPDGNPGTSYVIFPPGKTTPNASNFLPLTNVVINETLTHTDPPLEDAIELWNPTGDLVDISYWWLSNEKNNPKKFRIPTNTSIAAGTYKVFYEMRGLTNINPRPGFNTTGTGEFPDFTLNSAHGDTVYLFTADSAGNLTGYRRGIDFGSAENGVSFGRYITSTGEPDITAMSSRTFGHDNPSSISDFRLGTGLTNAYPKVGPLVITEIMYHPPDIVVGASNIDNTLDEYIEVYNLSSETVFLYDTHGTYFDPSYPQYGVYADGRTNTWRFRGAVDFNFPPNVSVAPGRFLLLVFFDPADSALLNAFRAKYSVPPDVPIYGPYGPNDKLKNSSGSIELYKPDAPQGPQHPDFRYVPYILAEKVKYSDNTPWPAEPDGNGPALQRIAPENYGNDPINWISGPPNPGRQYLRIESGTRTNNTFVLRFTGWAGTDYTVQWRDSFSTNSWAKLADVPVQATSGTRQVVDNDLGASPTRFYQIATPIQP